MISMSSWCAATHRCVVRASAASGANEASGTKISASGCEHFIGGEFLQSLQTRGRDRLTVTPIFFVRHAQADFFGQRGKFLAQHARRPAENDLAAGSGGHA